MIAFYLIILQTVLGQCTTPVQHVEWREMPITERQQYISAVQCLQRTPSRIAPNSRNTLYQDFVEVHRSIVPTAHGLPIFLPWHRFMLAAFDHALRTNCQYRGRMPYWDWSVDSQSPERSEIWSNTNGFGGNGNPQTGCISGPFSNYRNVQGQCVRRQWGNGQGTLIGAQYPPAQIEQILRSTSFTQFRNSLETLPHNSIHNAIGGDMFNTAISVNDPVFFLHHRNVDRLWYVWQRRNPSIANSYDGTPDAPINMFRVVQDTTVSQIMDTTGGGPGMCYTYSNSIRPNQINASLQKRDNSTSDSTQSSSPSAYDRKDLKNIRYIQPLSDNFMKQKGFSVEEINKIRQKEAEIRSFTDKLNADQEFLSTVRLEVFNNVKAQGWATRTDEEVKEERDMFNRVFARIQ